MGESVPPPEVYSFHAKPIGAVLKLQMVEDIHKASITSPTYRKRLIDLCQREVERDELIHHQLLLHVLLHQLRHSVPRLPAAERAALPDAPRHQLEGPRRDLLAGRCHAQDGRHAPALVARLQGRTLRGGSEVSGVTGSVLDVPSMATHYSFCTTEWGQF